MSSLEKISPAPTEAAPAEASTLLTLVPTTEEATSDTGEPAHDFVTCIVPCLNEYENLTLLLPTLRALLENCSGSWEIIVVDDGSTDGTPDLMTHWSAVDGVRYVQLSRNFGKEAALAAGLEAADGDAVICLDADMQHPPELIPQMLERWRNGADMVYAVRNDRDDEGWVKRAGARLFYRMLNGTRGVRVPPHAGDFRLMDRKVVEALIALPERTRFMKGLYAWVGFNAEPLPYTPRARHHGNSRYNLWRLTRLAADGLTAFTTWPLRVASLVGAVFALCSFCYGCFLVGQFLLHGNPVSGWTTIVTAVFFFAGLNLISLGIIGEYLARIFEEVKERPLFIARQRRGRARQARTANFQ